MGNLEQAERAERRLLAGGSYQGFLAQLDLLGVVINEDGDFVESPHGWEVLVPRAKPRYPRQRKPLVHGTRHGYLKKKCRCELCCEASRAYQREWRRRKAAR